MVTEVAKSTGVYWGKGSISKAQNDSQERPWAVLERWRLGKDSPHPDHTNGCNHGLEYERACNSVFKPFEVGNTNWQMNSEKHQKNLDNGEDLDDFQRHHVDRLVEQKIEEQPGFEWILLGAR